jgi:hypothetical protein
MLLLLPRAQFDPGKDVLRTIVSSLLMLQLAWNPAHNTGLTKEVGR